MGWLEKISIRKKKASKQAIPEEGASTNETADTDTATAMATTTATATVEPEAERAELLIKREPVDVSVPLLSVKGVERSFQVGSQTLHVLKGIDMTFYPQQLIMLRGRSGSGKTTLLNLLGGLDQPTKGEVLFRDRPIHKWSDEQRTELRRKEIGFIFQTFALMPLLSAYENVELGLRMADVPKQIWDRRVRHCLRLVGLERRMYHRPFEMSGGEQQRVAIAKAIVHRPNLLLADEPTADLDSQMSAQIMSVFRSIIETEGVTICMTTHDPTIMEVADHVFEMVDGRVTRNEKK